MLRAGLPDDAFTYQLYHLNPEIRKKSLSPETPRKKARDD
jgi:hypothetical protein